MKLLTLMGDTLAGKTTHGKKLAEEHRALYISSGSIARSLMDVKTQVSFGQGGLSPYDEKIRNKIKSMVLDHYEKVGSNALVILDGFPRTMIHRADIEEWFRTLWPDSWPCALLLDVPFDIIFKRSERRTRDQFDTTEIATKRHEVYLQETKPIFDTMDRSRWLKFAVKLHVEQPEQVVYGCVNRVCRGYLAGSTWVK